MKKLLLLFALCSSLGAWAQDFTPAPISDAEGAAVRRLEVTLSGNWLDGDNVEKVTTELIDMIMGYEEGAFIAGKAFTEVTIKSAEGTTVTVNQRLLQQLVTGKVTEQEGQLTWHTSNNKVTRLDLSGVAVTGYVGNTGSADRAADAICPVNVSPVVYFAMPSFEVRDDQTYTIPTYVLNGLTNMDELILPINTKKVGTAAFAALNYNKFKLNVGLEFIGNSAFHAASDRKGMETLDIPSSVKYIGPDAFWFRSFTDIYFHSAQAPICPVGYGVIEKADHAMLYNDCYMGNNGFTDSNEHAESQTSGVYPMGRDGGKPGKANRENYMSEGKRWMVMVHFPSSAEMAAEGKTLDIASYKDVTRVYNKVYGNIYGSGNDADKIEIAIPGHEQEYIARNKVWDEANSFDYVGKETTSLTYGGVTAVKDVNSGYEDTYRGLNYIWPSQSQWVRAFNTVALGYNWDGVSTYRPTLTPEQIALMVEDGLQVNMKQDGSGSGQWVAVGEDITYDVAKANEYNAGLEGAVHAGEAKAWYTAEEALEHNAKLDGAVSDGDTHTYSEAEAYANNANLPDAISTSDIKEPAVPSQPAVYYTDDEKQWVNNVCYVKETLIYHDAVPVVYYEDSEVIGINGTYYRVEDVVSLDGYYTAEYLNSLGVPDYNYLWSGDTKTDENGTTLYKFKGASVLHGATAVGYQNQLDQGQRFVKEAGSDAYWEVTADSKQVPSDNIKIPAVIGHDDIYYTETEVNQYNMDLDDAVKPGDEVTFTAETAAAYNAALTGAVKAGDEKEWWSAEEAIAENKKLPGAREAGYTSKSYEDPAIADLLSLVAFQSTRRCVFAANDGGGDDYDPKLPESQAWWTICLPFSLTKAQIDKYFGEGTHVCLFNKVERKISNLEEGERPYVKFYFTDDEYPKAADDNAVVLKAHVPYMIFPTLEETDAVKMAKVRIPMNDYYKETGNPIPTIVTATDGQEYRFIGNYDTMLPVVQEDGSVKTIDVVVPQYSYIYAKKNGATGKHPYQFWFTQNAGIKWGANKCIIQSTGADRGLSDNNTFFLEKQKGSEVKQITIFGYDEEDATSEETAIEEVIYVLGSGEDQQVIYNVNGMKLDVAPSKGVYIKNGKKYLAK